MNKYEIVKRIENFAPPETAEDWDCVGFMAETKKVDINKIMLCLTPTNDVIKQALAQNCDMIISHHPMFEINCHSELVSESFTPKIDIYSAHTNMDLAYGGTTDTLIEKFIDIFNKKNHPSPEFVNSQSSLTNSILSLKGRGEREADFVRYIEFEDFVELDNITDILRKISPNLRYVNNNRIEKVKKIGFCAGSGSEFISEAQTQGADCFVTGDLKFHTALDSEIVVFDIGHFESEIMILQVFKRIIGENVEIVFAEEKTPFIV